MGHPRKLRKKYTTPSHPWQRERMEKESEIKKFYSLKNKKEIWKANSILKNFKMQAKKIIREKTSQSKKEGKQLMDRLKKLNLLNSDKQEDILNLTIENVLDRRLQTQVFKLGLARSIKQARQLIKHGHIFVTGKKMTIPSYLVNADDAIKYSPKSSFNNPEHPERITENTKIIKKEAEEIKETSIKEEPGVESVVENG